MNLVIKLTEKGVKKLLEDGGKLRQAGELKPGDIKGILVYHEPEENRGPSDFGSAILYCDREEHFSVEEAPPEKVEVPKPPASLTEAIGHLRVLIGHA